MGTVLRVGAGLLLATAILPAQAPPPGAGKPADAPKAAPAAAPEIIARMWDGEPVEISALKGNVILLVFWQPGVYSGHESRLKGLQARIDAQVGKNVVAVGIARGYTEKTFPGAAAKYGMKFPCALDVGDATRKMYGLPTDEPCGAVLDPDGKIVARATLDSYVGDGPDKGKNYIDYMFDRTVQKHGARVSGGDDAFPPAKAVPVAELARRGEYGKALAAARKLPDAPADLAEYRDKLVKRLEEKKEAAVAEIGTGATDDARKFRAYLAAERFLKTYAGEKEVADVKALQAKLKSDEVVKREMAARDLFYQAAALMDGAKSKASAVYPLLAKIQNDYAGTTYARYAAAMAR